MSTGPLNLSDADLRGFEAVDAGRYNAEVFAITMDAVKNTSGQGKLPAGTPMVKIQFKLLSDSAGNTDVDNRRVFASYAIPPKDYDAKKAATMKGILARFFIELGESEETVLNKKFEPNLDDYVGRQCVVTVGKEPKKTADGTIIEGEFNNPVKGVKKAGSIGAGAGAGLL